MKQVKGKCCQDGRSASGMMTSFWGFSVWSWHCRCHISLRPMLACEQGGLSEWWKEHICFQIKGLRFFSEWWSQCTWVTSFESPVAFTGMCKPQTRPEIHLQTALEDVRWLPCHHFSFPDERLLCSSKIKEDK